METALEGRSPRAAGAGVPRANGGGGREGARRGKGRRRPSGGRGATGWAVGGAVGEGAAVAVGRAGPAGVAPARGWEGRRRLHGRPGGLGRDGLCGGSREWGGPRTESPHGVDAMEAKSRNSLQEDRAICKLSSISCCLRDLGPIEDLFPDRSRNDRVAVLVEREVTCVCCHA